MHLDWDKLNKEAEEENKIVFQMLGKVLESVMEENSELCETP